MTHTFSYLRRERVLYVHCSRGCHYKRPSAVTRRSASRRRTRRVTCGTRAPTACATRSSSSRTTTGGPARRSSFPRRVLSNETARLVAAKQLARKALTAPYIWFGCFVMNRQARVFKKEATSGEHLAGPEALKQASPRRRNAEGSRRHRSISPLSSSPPRSRSAVRTERRFALIDIRSELIAPRRGQLTSDLGTQAIPRRC